MDRFINLLSTIVKTMLTLALAFVVGLFAFIISMEIGAFYFSRGIGTIGLIICCAVGIAMGIIVFWKLCPADTKTWFRNWTKPTNSEK